MKTFLLYLIIAFLAIVVQATLFTGVKPDFVLVLVCLYALKAGQIRGVTYGTLTGLMIDSANGYIFGPNIMSKALSGFLTAWTRQKFFDWSMPLNTVLIFLLSVFDNFVVYMFFESFAPMSFAGRPWTPSILHVVYTTIAGMALYLIMNRKRPQEIFN